MALAFVVLALVAPLLWMVAASFKTNVDIYDTGKALVFSPTRQLRQGLQQANDFQFIVNSLWVAFAAIVIVSTPHAVDQSGESLNAAGTDHIARGSPAR